MIEVLKQMQEALREYHYYTFDAGLPNQSMLNKGYAAFQAGKKVIAELESQEPVVTKNKKGLTLHTGWDDLPVGTKLYTHPPQRTWVGLTDEEIAQGYETTGHYQTLRPQDKFAVYALARAIEAKLKEKNGYAEEKNS